MKRLTNYFQVNKRPLIVTIIVAGIVFVLGWVASSEIRKVVDYLPLIDSLENRIERDRQALTDSVEVFDLRISSQKKEIEILSDKIRVQSAEITKIKKDYEIRRNHINSLDVDGTVLESRRQLSK